MVCVLDEGPLSVRQQTIELRSALRLCKIKKGSFEASKEPLIVVYCM